LADAHVSQENTTTDPLGGYQLDDTLPFQISQVLKVLNGYDRYKKRMEDIQEDLADAKDQIARHIATLAVALLRPPRFHHRKRAPQVFGVIDWSSTDSAEYALATSRVFRS
jgi:hypothetical protein